MSNELAREVTRSMRNERHRWKAPDHGWSVDLYCLRDDGLEVMQDYKFGFETPTIRIQGLGDPSYHYSQSMKLEPVRMKLGWPFSASRTLRREMQALHREKDRRKSAEGLRALRA